MVQELYVEDNTSIEHKSLISIQSISKFTNKELVSIKYKGMVKPT